MYKFFFKLLVIAALFTSCNNNKKEKQPDSDPNAENVQMPAEDLEAINPEDKGASIDLTENKNSLKGHEQTIASFPNLKYVSPKGYENVFVFYDSEHTQVINEKENKSEGEPVILMLKTKLDNKEKDIYTVTFSPGMSDDPLFTIKKGDKEINSFTALELILPGNGSVYTTGHTNNMFDERRKFQLKDGKIKESKQSYLYVGLHTKTVESFQIYSDLNYSKPIATLPKDTEIEVLVNQGRNYLIRTPFGITGWWKYNGDHKTPIKGLSYAGD